MSRSEFEEIIDQTLEAYTNIFLIAYNDHFDLKEIVSGIEETIKNHRYDNKSAYYPEGFWGLTFFSAVAREMDCSLYRVLYMQNLEQKSIIRDIINRIPETVEDIEYDTQSDITRIVSIQGITCNDDCESENAYYRFDITKKSNGANQYKYKMIMSQEEKHYDKTGSRTKYMLDCAEIWEETSSENKPGYLSDIVEAVLAKKRDLSEKKAVDIFNREYFEFFNDDSDDRIKERGFNTDVIDNIIPANIEMQDFVIKKNVFSCTHAGHTVKNINAQISIVDKTGKIIKKKVNAGYCPVCKVFFILESTYQMLKRNGIILCQITDEQAYYEQTKTVNGMNLAKESVLMRYGYNVSQKENLTYRQRCSILATLVDQNIISREEIISYIDFFINQRMGISSYQVAISKWEEDRKFISDYRKGDFSTYGVKSIKRRH